MGDLFGFLFIFLVAGLIGACVTAWIADNKQRNFWGWALFGACIFIVALPLILILPALKKCPECAESVKKPARKCPWCGYAFAARIAV